MKKKTWGLKIRNLRRMLNHGELHLGNPTTMRRNRLNGLVESHWKFTLQIGPIFINEMLYRQESHAVMSPIKRLKGKKRVRLVNFTGGIHAHRVAGMVEEAISARSEDLSIGDHQDVAHRGKFWKTRPYPRKRPPSPPNWAVLLARGIVAPVPTRSSLLISASK
jgi:hypothetical protein